MIGILSGKLLEKSLPVLVVGIAGIGYEVEVPVTTFVNLPDVDGEVSLFTHFVVRENAQLLYGFTTREDRDLFRMLIASSGVGPKLALAILSGMSAAEFYRCVEEQDSLILVGLPGVGKKTAARLLVEMRDRLPDQLVTKPRASLSASSATKVEAESALCALGYTPQKARHAVQAVWMDDMTVEQVIMLALKGMVDK